MDRGWFHNEIARPPPGEPRSWVNKAAEAMLLVRKCYQTFSYPAHHLLLPLWPCPRCVADSQNPEAPSAAPLLRPDLGPNRALSRARVVPSGLNTEPKRTTRPQKCTSGPLLRTTGALCGLVVHFGSVLRPLGTTRVRDKARFGPRSGLGTTDPDGELTWITGEVPKRMAGLDRLRKRANQGCEAP